MVLLKIQCLNVGELREPDISKIQLFSFAEMGMDDAEKIQNFVQLNPSHTSLRSYYSYDLTAEIISDPFDIKAIQKCFKFEKEYNSCNYNFIMGIINNILYLSCCKIIIMIENKGYIDLASELECCLDNALDSGEYDKLKNFEDKLLNVMCALFLHKLLPTCTNSEIGIMVIIRSYIDTKGYNNQLKEIIPKFY